MRIAVGAAFFRSGLLKVNSWEFAVQLFRDEYKVPLLDPLLAAQLATVVELAVPSFLFAGLATRLATLPLLGMIAVIQIFVLSERVERPPAVELDTRIPVDARRRGRRRTPVPRPPARDPLTGIGRATKLRRIRANAGSCCDGGPPPSSRAVRGAPQRATRAPRAALQPRRARHTDSRVARQ